MKLFLIFLFLLPFAAKSQEVRITAGLYHISELQILTTDEKPKVLPRGFIYDMEFPDSVVYLSCIGSDQKLFRDYFDGKPAFKFHVGDTIYRASDDVIDTIAVRSLHQQMWKYSPIGLEQIVSPRYVLIYFLPADGDKLFRENVAYFERYVRRDRKTAGIQTIYVMGDF